MKHEPKKHFDISKPRHHSPDPTSKPIIVGHHPMMPDPMIKEERDKAAKPIKVISDGGESEPPEVDQQPKTDFPSASKPPENSSTQIPAEGPPPQPVPESQLSRDLDQAETVPGAIFTSAVADQETRPAPAAESPTTVPLAPAAATPSSDIQPPKPLPTQALDPTTLPEPPAGQELHIPAGHATVHHKPRVWVWVLVAIIILIWVYAAVDALTETKLPYEFFKKEIPVAQDTTFSTATENSQPSMTTVASGVREFKDTELHISFKYPSTWTLDDYAKGEIDPGTSERMIYLLSNPVKVTRYENNKLVELDRPFFIGIVPNNSNDGTPKPFGNSAGSCELEPFSIPGDSNKHSLSYYGYNSGLERARVLYLTNDQTCERGAAGYYPLTFAFAGGEASYIIRLGYYNTGYENLPVYQGGPPAGLAFIRYLDVCCEGGVTVSSRDVFKATSAYKEAIEILKTLRPV